MALLNDIETFFQAVEEDSVTELQEIVANVGPEEIAEIANSFNDDGETLLLVAIKRNQYKLVKFLVEEMKVKIDLYGRLVWKHLDYMEVPPIFAAIMCDHTPEQSIINFLMDQDLMANNNDASHMHTFVDSIKSSCLNWAQKIDILELVGSAYILKVIQSRKQSKSLTIGMHFWFVSLILRRGDYGRPPLRKEPCQLSESARKVFEDAAEFTTSEELKAILDSLNECHLQTQALLIIHRVVSKIHPDPHPFFLHQLLHFGQRWFLNQPKRLAAIVMFCINTFQVPDYEAEDAQWPKGIVEKTLVLTSLCSQLTRNLPPDSAMEILSCYSGFQTRVLEHADATTSLKQEISKKLAPVIADFIENMLMVNPDGTAEFNDWLAQYMGFINRHSDVLTLLHAACQRPSRFKLIPLLLKAEADPNASDENGKAPLYYLSKKSHQDEAATAVQWLLDAGAHKEQATRSVRRKKN